MAYRLSLYAICCMDWTNRSIQEILVKVHPEVNAPVLETSSDNDVSSSACKRIGYLIPVNFLNRLKRSVFDVLGEPELRWTLHTGLSHG